MTKTYARCDNYKCDKYFQVIGENRVCDKCGQKSKNQTISIQQRKKVKKKKRVDIEYCQRLYV